MVLLVSEDMKVEGCVHVFLTRGLWFLHNIGISLFVSRGRKTPLQRLHRVKRSLTRLSSTVTLSRLLAAV